MKAESKTCVVCLQGTENQYNLCKHCWLALKLLDHDPNRLRRGLRYCKKLGRRKVEIQSDIPPKWESAKQKADWYKRIREKTTAHLKAEKAHQAELAAIPHRIKVVRDGQTIKTVDA